MQIYPETLSLPRLLQLHGLRVVCSRTELVDLIEEGAYFGQTIATWGAWSRESGVVREMEVSSDVPKAIR